jgi:hypothetical protein
MRRSLGLALLGLALPTLPVLAQARDSIPKRHEHMMHGQDDSSFAALKERGRTAMHVDQDRAVHHFDALPDGGRIELQSTTDDSTAIAGIRAHFKEIERAFRKGDFAIPMFVHDKPVPGTAVMAAKKDRITYTRRDLARGAELRLRTTDPEALEAIHEFMAFQREEHHAPGVHQ